MAAEVSVKLVEKNSFNRTPESLRLKLVTVVNQYLVMKLQDISQKVVELLFIELTVQISVKTNMSVLFL